MTILSDDLKELNRKLSDIDIPRRPHLGANHLEQLGKIVVNFERLDYEIGVLIGVLLEINDNPVIVHTLTAGLTFNNLLNLLSCINVETFNSNEDLEVIIKNADKANSTRNSILHSYWIGPNAPGASTTQMNIKAGRKGVFKIFKDYSEEDLALIAQEIEELYECVEHYRVKIWREIFRAKKSNTPS